MRNTDRMMARNNIAQRQGTLAALLTAAVLSLSMLTSSAVAASYDANSAQVQPLTKGSKLIGKDIVDAQYKKLGEINVMAIDLGNYRIVFVVVLCGGFLGFG